MDEFLRSIDLGRLEDVIAALENYEDDFPVESVVPASAVLLNLLPRLPERQRGMMTLGTRSVVRRVVLHLLRRLPGQVEVEAAVGEILPKVKSLTTKLELVTIVGHHEGAGHRLVSEEAAEGLERALRDEIRAATPDELAEESDPLDLLLTLGHWGEDGEPVIAPTADAGLNAKILAASRHEIRSQTVGNRAVRRTPSLSWDALIKVYGGEDHVREAVETLRPMAESDERLAETIELADRYLTGWRPDRSDD